MRDKRPWEVGNCEGSGTLRSETVRGQGLRSEAVRGSGTVRSETVRGQGP